MKFSAAVGYAVRSILHVAEHSGGKPVSCKAIVDEKGFPPKYLLQILRQLVEGGLLTSTRGMAGGYLLAKPLDEITMLEVVEAIDGPITLNVSGLARTKGIESMRTKVRAYLGRVRLSSLAPSKV